MNDLHHFIRLTIYCALNCSFFFMYYTDSMSSICDKISGLIVPEVNATAIIINILGFTLPVNSLHKIFIGI